MPILVQGSMISSLTWVRIMKGLVEGSKEHFRKYGIKVDGGAQYTKLCSLWRRNGTERELIECGGLQVTGGGISADGQQQGVMKELLALVEGTNAGFERRMNHGDVCGAISLSRRPVAT